MRQQTIRKNNHRIFLFKSSLLSRMTFRNNSWHPIRVAQTSRLPLGQTEGLQIKHSHYLPIQQSQQRCANACFTCCRHTDIPPFCQPTKVFNLSALPKKSSFHQTVKLDMLFFPSHHLTQRRTNIQVHTYRADSDRTPSPG